MSDLPAGTLLGAWMIARCLGRGGMGEVYEAVNTLSGARRALKRIRPALLGSTESRERFLREVALSQRVKHPNVVVFLDPFTVDDQVILPMELLVGETLAQRLRRGPFSPVAATVLIATVARGAGALHREGLIHRDLKPGNVFLAREPDGTETAKILDLGATSGVLDPRLTRTGFSIGTIAYMAPEQIRERVLDARVDVYALGVLLYLCLTGRRPFEDDAQGSILRKHAEGAPIAPPSALGVFVPEVVEAVVMRALARKREFRYPDGDALADALDTAIGRPSLVAVAAPRFGSEDGARPLAFDEASATEPPPPNDPEGTATVADDEGGAAC